MYLWDDYVRTLDSFQFGGSMFAHMVSGITGSMQAESAAAGSALHPSHIAEESLAKSAASAYQWGGLSQSMRSADWYGLGQASGVKNRITAEQYKDIAESQGQMIGRQQFENMWAQTMASGSLGQRDKFRSALNQVQRGFSKAQTTELAMKNFGLDHPQAQRLLSGEIALGNLSEKAQKAILGDVMGKDFLNYLNKNPNALEAFSGLKYKGVPGKIGMLDGVIGKAGIDLLSQYAKDHNKPNIANSLSHFQGENAVLNAIGGSNLGGLSKLGIEEGMKSEVYDFANTKQLENIQAQQDYMKIQLGAGNSLSLQDATFHKEGNKLLISGRNNEGQYVVIEGQGKISRSGQLASFSQGQYKMSSYNDVENTWGNAHFKPLGIDGFGKVSKQGDYNTFTGMFDAINGEKIIEALQKQGYNNAAKGLENLLKKHNAVRGSIVTDDQGNILSFQAGNQAFVDNKDLRTVTKGAKGWTGSSWQNVHEKINKGKVDYINDPGFILELLDKKNKGIRDFVLQQLENNPRQTMLGLKMATTKLLTDAFYSHTGIDSGVSNWRLGLDGSIGWGRGKKTGGNSETVNNEEEEKSFLGKILSNILKGHFRVGAHGTLDVGNQNIEKEQVDLIKAEIDAIERSALKQATDINKNVDYNKFLNIFTQEVGKVYNKASEYFSTRNSIDYGKSALGSVVKDGFNKPRDIQKKIDSIYKNLGHSDNPYIRRKQEELARLEVEDDVFYVK